MPYISVEINENSYGSIRSFLDDRDRNIINDNMVEKCTQENKIIYSLKKCDEENLIKSEIADILTKCIVERYENTLIGKILNNNYSYFNGDEKREINNIALKIINDKDSLVEKIFQTKRKNYIYKRLIEYLEVHDHIILEGFINFRLKEYILDLQTIVDKAVDFYLTDKEYKEFIRLLQYFVEIQEPKIDTVHLKLRANGEYKLCDEGNEEITYLYMEDMRDEFLNNELSQEDILLGALITISPKKIIFHGKNTNFHDVEIFNTISSIFNERIEIYDE